MTASILSGRAISRMGRYRVFPIAGTAVTTVGLFLLSRLEVDTPPWLASVFMLVLGVGIGLVMQVIVLVVQNDAPPRDIGVATSTATFFRSMGGSLGVAFFGAIFASRLTASSSAARRGRRAASRRREHQPRAGLALPDRYRHDFLLAFVDALQPVFIVGAVVTAVAFVLAWLLKEVPLRGTTQARPGPVADPGLEVEYEEPVSKR